MTDGRLRAEGHRCGVDLERVPPQSKSKRVAVFG
jgi:hypothetical protein